MFKRGLVRLLGWWLQKLLFLILAERVRLMLVLLNNLLALVLTGRRSRRGSWLRLLLSEGIVPLLRKKLVRHVFFRRSLGRVVA